MERRTFIGSLGVLTGLSTAGCLGTGGNGNDSSNNSSVGGGTKTEEPQIDVPDFEAYVNEDAPGRFLLLAATILTDELQYGDRFKAKVAVANTGGESLSSDPTIYPFGASGVLVDGGESLSSDLTIRAHPAIGQGSYHEDFLLESSITVDELGGGEVEQFTVGPFEPPSAGDWTLDAGTGFHNTHDDFEAVVHLDSKEKSIGQTIEVPDGLHITPAEPVVCHAVHYNHRESIGVLSGWDAEELHQTVDDQVLIINQFTLENAGTEVVQFGQDSYADGIVYHPRVITPTVGKTLEQVGGEAYLEAVELPGTPFRQAEIEPGNSVEAWIITQVDIEELPDAGLNHFFRANTDTPEVHIDYGLDEDAIPEFELKETDVPDERTDEEQDLEFVVENVGDRAGPFYGAVQIKSPYMDEWRYLPEGLKATIEPGEKQRVRTTTDPDRDEDEAPYTYRVAPFGKEFEL